MMLKLLINLVLVFKPVHIIQNDEKSCGAEERLLKETIKIAGVKVNYTNWKLVGSDSYYIALEYQAQPNAYMVMGLRYNKDEAYLTIQGIDVKREPCRDTVYMKRIK